jgi:hypothetical protein
VFSLKELYFLSLLYKKRFKNYNPYWFDLNRITYITNFTNLWPVCNIKFSVITVGILNRWILSFEGFVRNIWGNNKGQFPQTFLTNPSKRRIYLCKISTVITETLIVYNTTDYFFITSTDLVGCRGVYISPVSNSWSSI